MGVALGLSNNAIESLVMYEGHFGAGGGDHSIFTASVTQNSNVLPANLSRWVPSVSLFMASEHVGPLNVY